MDKKDKAGLQRIKLVELIEFGLMRLEMPLFAELLIKHQFKQENLNGQFKSSKVTIIRKLSEQCGQEFVSQ